MLHHPRQFITYNSVHVFHFITKYQLKYKVNIKCQKYVCLHFEIAAERNVREKEEGIFFSPTPADLVRTYAYPVDFVSTSPPQKTHKFYNPVFFFTAFPNHRSLNFDICLRTDSTGLEPRALSSPRGRRKSCIAHFASLFRQNSYHIIGLHSGCGTLGTSGCSRCFRSVLYTVNFNSVADNPQSSLPFSIFFSQFSRN